MNKISLVTTPKQVATHDKWVQDTPIDDADKQGQVEGAVVKHPEKLVQPVDLILPVVFFAKTWGKKHFKVQSGIGSGLGKTSFLAFKSQKPGMVVQ